MGGYQKELREGKRTQESLGEQVREDNLKLQWSKARRMKEKRSEKEYRQTKEVGSVGERLELEGMSWRNEANMSPRLSGEPARDGHLRWNEWRESKGDGEDREGKGGRERI